MTIKQIIEERRSAFPANYDTIGFRDRAKMLTFIKKDGTRFSANYSYLYGIWAFGHGIRLDYGKTLVIISGERLEIVLTALSEHRAHFLRESESSGELRTGPLITNISVIHEKADSG